MHLSQYSGLASKGGVSLACRGAMLQVNDGDQIVAGQVVATWDPHTHPIITEVAGKVKFSEMSE